MRKSILLVLLIFISAFGFSQKAKRTETVLINGKNLHYQVYGEGKPLIFLHGYTLSSKSWLPYVANFQDEYEVYLIDLPGHGKSHTFAEDLSIKSVAKDLDLLIQYLGLEKIQAIGFSYGGDILYQLALHNPTLIKSMITIGAVGTWSIDDFPAYKEAFTFENRANFPWLALHHDSNDKIKALMEQFNIYKVSLSDEELQSIKPEVLIMIGDDDEGMDLNEVARVKKYLPKSDLWILPNVSHGAHEGASKPEFLIKAKAFLLKE